jgi:Zn-dependent protease
MEEFFLKLSVMLVPGLMAITFHEVSHGYVAWRFGDPTARILGRLSLNPIKHIDLIGTIMLFIAGIGWAKPVPVEFANLRNPKRDMVWVAAAGPVTNLLLAIISALLFHGLSMLMKSASQEIVSTVMVPVFLMLYFSVSINLMLALFNMIPLPPLDGGRVLVGLLPDSLANSLAKVEPYGMFIVILLVVTRAIGPILFPAHNFLMQILIGSSPLGQVLRPIMQ